MYPVSSHTNQKSVLTAGLLIKCKDPLVGGYFAHRPIIILFMIMFRRFWSDSVRFVPIVYRDLFPQEGAD